MCRAVEQLQMKTLARGEAIGRARGRAEGEAGGRAQERLRMSCALIKDGLLSIEVASAKFNISIETIRAYLDGHEE